MYIQEGKRAQVQHSEIPAWAFHKFKVNLPSIKIEAVDKSPSITWLSHAKNSKYLCCHVALWSPLSHGFTHNGRFKVLPSEIHPTRERPHSLASQSSCPWPTWALILTFLLRRELSCPRSQKGLLLSWSGTTCSWLAPVGSLSAGAPVAQWPGLLWQRPLWTPACFQKGKSPCQEISCNLVGGFEVPFKGCRWPGVGRGGLVSMEETNYETKLDRKSVV